MSLDVKISDQACGAEVTGVDLTQQLSDTEILAIREAWLEHMYSVFLIKQ